MKLNGLIYNLPGELRNLIIPFVVVLSIGYFVGVMFIDHTSSLNPKGIQDNYLGNEVTEPTDVIKFKKSTYQMFNLIHTHVISMAIIFFIMGLLLSITDLNKYLKGFLIIEPFCSIIVTFFGIYYLWTGVLWMKYLIFISSILMTFVFFISAFVVLYQSIFIKK